MKKTWTSYTILFWTHDPKINDCTGNTSRESVKGRSPEEALRKVRKNRKSFRLHSISEEISRIGRFYWTLCHKPVSGEKTKENPTLEKSYIFQSEERDLKGIEVILEARFLPGNREPITAEYRGIIQDYFGNQLHF